MRARRRSAADDGGRDRLVVAYARLGGRGCAPTLRGTEQNNAAAVRNLGDLTDVDVHTHKLTVRVNPPRRLVLLKPRVESAFARWLFYNTYSNKESSKVFIRLLFVTEQNP